MQTPSFYWLRQPLISIERLLALLAEDRLADLLNDSQVVEAIRIASPSLFAYLQPNYISEPKVAETIVKYVLRMSTRCTPFGLFAGGSVGHPAKTTVFDFTDRQLIPHHRLDTQVLASLAYTLSCQPAIRRSLRYYVNRSVHRIGNRLRYTESQWQAEHWLYYSSEVSVVPDLTTVLSLAQVGATISELVEAVSNETHQAEAYDFIERLIEDGLLVSELLPTPTGLDPLARLIQKLEAFSSPPTVLGPLCAIDVLLSQAKGKPQPALAVTQILTEQIGLSVKQGRVLQTDLQIIGGKNHLSNDVLNQLQRTLSPLHVLNDSNVFSSELAEFKERFFARYERQEIPLLSALDEEIGIGYTTGYESISSSHGLLDKLLNQSSLKSISSFQANELHKLRIQLYSGWVPQNGDSVEITDQDLIRLSKKTDFFSKSYYAFGYFLATSAAAIDTGHFQFVLKSLSGPSAFNLMGRFCSTDHELSAEVIEHLNRQQEVEPYRIFAEIVHMPQARTGNVIQRPHLRAYEIPYLTQSDLPVDQQIFPEDLMISIPYGQRIVLRSKKLDKEIVPQLTTAHDHRSGIPLYQFLCDLQLQENPFSVGWQWGALSQARRLPRVYYKNIILLEAIWSFSLSDLLPGLSDEENVSRLRANDGLPRLVAIKQDDQELFIDLDSSLCCQLFVSTLSRLKRIQVVEWLRTPDKCPIHGPDGRMTHEIVIPFTDFTRLPKVNKPIITSTSLNVRCFAPGSEWLYVKVYCGPSTANTILEKLVQFTEQALSEGRLTHWFFIRYRDPDNHLRVRFRLSNKDQAGSLLETCRQALASFLSSGELYRFQVDTYFRELERYGDATISHAEHIFWRDSEAVCRILKLDLSESTLFATALLGIDQYYTAFGITPLEKLKLYEQVYLKLIEKREDTSGLQKILAHKYRTNQLLVERLFQLKFTAEEIPAYQIINQLYELIQPYINQIRIYMPTNNQTCLEECIISLGHLFINRLFETDQSTYELLVYHHLYRANQSFLSRNIL